MRGDLARRLLRIEAAVPDRAFISPVPIPDRATAEEAARIAEDARRSWRALSEAEWEACHGAPAP